MLKSILGSWAQVIEILDEKSKHDEVHLLRSRESLIKELARFLSPFEIATKGLECWKEPTIYLIQYYLSALITHCSPNNQDTQVEKVMPDGSMGWETILADSMWIKALKPSV